MFIYDFPNTIYIAGKWFSDSIFIREVLEPQLN